MMTYQICFYISWQISNQFLRKNDEKTKRKKCIFMAKSAFQFMLRMVAAKKADFLTQLALLKSALGRPEGVGG